MNHARSIRRSALFVLAGLLVQLGSTIHWTPLTFVLFSMVGAPLVLIGVVLYAATVISILKQSKVI